MYNNLALPTVFNLFFCCGLLICVSNFKSCYVVSCRLAEESIGETYLLPSARLADVIKDHNEHLVL